MGVVLPDVDVHGAFPSADDIISLLDARGVVLIYRGRLFLRETKTLQKRPEVQDLATSH